MASRKSKRVKSKRVKIKKRCCESKRPCAGCPLVAGGRKRRRRG